MRVFLTAFCISGIIVACAFSSDLAQACEEVARYAAKAN